MGHSSLLTKENHNGCFGFTVNNAGHFGLCLYHYRLPLCPIPASWCRSVYVVCAGTYPPLREEFPACGLTPPGVDAFSCGSKILVFRSGGIVPEKIGVDIWQPGISQH